MKLCITEKPSVAADISRILGATTRRKGYYEGNNVCVTWTYGHLCTLKEPADYCEAWKRWSLGSLPMIPLKFGIKLIDSPSIKEQFSVIKQLASQADEIINCGDAGQEGELIQRWVMQKARVKCPVRRLWISSLTDEAIREGFKTLQPQDNFKNLYLAGLSRAVGDWVLGLNATRLYTLKYSHDKSLLSVGRVQTPTLAIVVQRQKEIDNFVPENFWEITTTYREVVFKNSNVRYSSEEQANDVSRQISDLPLEICKIEKKDGKEYPPKLFDLTSLQVECNKLWGWSADNCLKLIQSLYEKKMTTYPRVDTTYLTDDIYPKVPKILRDMTPYARFTEPLLKGKISKTKRIFDNSKVTDHHAIIPTGVSPSSLSDPDERKLYHLIALRFIAAFYPEALFQTTVVIAKVGDYDFKATGKHVTSPGWRVLYPAKDNANEQGDDSQEMPEFVVGESGPHKPEVLTRQTQPPKYFTEGTLLRAMESAGKGVDDEELREAMKANGIGRPSTRSAIIETLFKRGYIERKRKSIAATAAGIQLIDTIRDDLLKSPKLTGIWENKLRQIEAGTYKAENFIAELKEMVQSIVFQVLSDNSNIRIAAVQSTSSSSTKPAQKKKPSKKAIKEKAK